VGFATAASFVIIFIAGLTAGVQLLLAGDSYFTTLAEGMEVQSERDMEFLQTDLEIVKVSQQGATTLIYAENTGSTTLDPDYISLAIDDQWIESDNFAVTSLGYFNGTRSQKTMLVKGAYQEPPSTGGQLTLSTGNITQVSSSNNRLRGIVGWFNITVAESNFASTNSSPSFYWRPEDVIEVKASKAVSTKVKLMVENGAWDVYRLGEETHTHELSIEDGYNYVWD